MITKNDCLSLLTTIDDKDTNKYIKILLTGKNIPLEVLQFIADKKGLELMNFYDHIRQNHNKKKSPLYVNIIKESDDYKNIRTTLSSFLNQALLYSNKLDDSTKFLKEARVEEVSRALNTYFKSDDMGECLAVMRLIRADLFFMEYVADRRKLV